MFGKIGDMMEKLQVMKQRSEEIKIKLDGIVLKSEGAGGDIKIEITGNREFKNISIAGSLQHADKQEMEEQLLIALNKAIREADKVNESEMKKAATGLIPGM